MRCDDDPTPWDEAQHEIKSLEAISADLLAQCEAFRAWYVTEWGEDDLAMTFPALDSVIAKAKGDA